MPVAEDPLVKLREIYSLFMWEPGASSKTKLAKEAMEEVGRLRSVDLTDTETAEMKSICNELMAHLGV